MQIQFNVYMAYLTILSILLVHENLENRSIPKKVFAAFPYLQLGNEWRRAGVRRSSELAASFSWKPFNFVNDFSPLCAFKWALKWPALEGVFIISYHTDYTLIVLIWNPIGGEIVFPVQAVVHLLQYFTGRGGISAVKYFPFYLVEMIIMV